MTTAPCGSWQPSGPHPCCVHERMSSQTGGSSLPAPITRKKMGQIEALEGLAERSAWLNGAFSRAQGSLTAMSGAPAALVGRNDSHKPLYNHDTLDCWTGSVAAATLRRELRASAIASPPRRSAGAKPSW